MQGLSRFITTFPSRHSTTPFQRFIQQQNKPFFQFATFSSRRHLCTASSVTKVQDIRQFAPRFEKQLNQFLQETQHISAKDELELRSLREHQRFSEFIQQEIRGLIKLQPISAIVLYCIQPLLERCNIKYVALILELADLMPNYLLEIILTVQKSYKFFSLFKIFFQFFLILYFFSFIFSIFVEFIGTVFHFKNEGSQI